MVERLSDFVFVLSVAARQKMVEHEVGDIATEPMTARQVATEVHARENTALGGFLCNRGEARERALDAREDF